MHRISWLVLMMLWGIFVAWFFLGCSSDVSYVYLEGSASCVGKWEPAAAFVRGDTAFVKVAVCHKTPRVEGP